MARHLLLLLTWLSVFSSVFSQSAIRCHSAENDILIRIPSSCKIAEEGVPDCCSWRRIQCDGSTNQVIGLDLSDCASNNTISSGSPVFQLRHLRKLDVTTSDVHYGTIPNEIGNLNELEELMLYGFQGPIPSSIGDLTRLKKIQLSFGLLSGTIPASIGNLRNLTELILSSNKLSGSIPASIRNLTLLETLDLAVNNLAGPLPFPILELPNLHYFGVHHNGLEGALPRSIRLDSNLTEFDIRDNLFTGNVPSWLFTRSLRSLWASGNKFSGVEPFRPPKVSYLDQVLLGSNLIKEIPKNLFLLKNLALLTLDENCLSGGLDLRDLKDMKVLDTLNMSSNKGLSLVSSKGPFPPYLNNLFLNDCNITEFPNFLNSLPKLELLFLRGNKMRGSVDLSEGWERLYKLDASCNFLEGYLPIPPCRLSIFNLSHNNFIGDVSRSFCGIWILDLSFNRLHGVLQWNRSNCVADRFESIILNNNKLHGSIPELFFSGLRLLRLNDNHLLQSSFVL